MEKRIVDPKILIDNPENPRSSAPNVTEDRRLALNIKAVGLLHPPLVRERDDGALVIVAGHRRRRAAILAGLKQIDVLVREGDPKFDHVASSSENIIRQSMTEPETWRAVTKMRADGHKEKFICQALMLRPNELRALEKLALLHPPILALIERGDGPAPRERNAIARVALEDQASAWAECWAESEADAEGDEDSIDASAFDPALYVPEAREIDADFWIEFAAAFQVNTYYARDAAFDDVIAQAHGIAWEEDLFAPADMDSRSTTDGDAYRAAQEAWLHANPTEDKDVFGVTEYDGPDLPEGGYVIRDWMGRDGTERIACWVDPRSLKIREQEYRIRKVRVQPSTDDGDLGLASGGEDNAPKVRADISAKGYEMIGAIRTQALHGALDAARDTVDPWDLVAGLLLAFQGGNVHVHGDPTGSNWGEPGARARATAELFPEGVLVRAPDLLRQHAIAVLKSVANCGVSTHSGSGLSAQVLGYLFGADAHMPSLAFDDFLKTMSKPALTKAVRAEGLEPKGTGKEMRAALMAHVGDGRWMPDAAGFAQVYDPWKRALDHQREREEASARRTAMQTDDDADSDDDQADSEERDEAELAMPVASEPGAPAEDEAHGDASGDAPRVDPAQFAREHFEVVVVR